MLEPTILSVVNRYRSGALSPIEIAQTVLAQIERVEPQLNAFVLREDPERVLEAAAASQARWRRGAPLGPLDGIPITIKDTIWVAGWPTRSGSRTTTNAASAEDAPAVARVREAGAIILGKTTTPEFGWKAVTDSPLTGISLQSLEHRENAGRIQWRRCRRGRRGRGVRVNWNGCGRICAHPRVVLRACRIEGD